MNVLDLLLGPAPEGADPLRREYLLQGSIPITFEEDVSAEEVCIATWPGRMPHDDWLASLSGVWTASVASPLDERALDSLTVEPVTGRTMLLSIWPRAALTEQALEAAMEGRATAHRAWQSLLLNDDPTAA